MKRICTSPMEAWRNHNETLQLAGASCNLTRHFSSGNVSLLLFHPSMVRASVVLQSDARVAVVKTKGKDCCAAFGVANFRLVA
eukprot:scaffold29389_cov68-Cyclotella_meneghiniana.AAC.1